MNGVTIWSVLAALWKLQDSNEALIGYKPSKGNAGVAVYKSITLRYSVGFGNLWNVLAAIYLKDLVFVNR